MRKLKACIASLAILLAVFFSFLGIRSNAASDTPADDNADLTLTLEQQETTSDDVVTNIRYICTLGNVTDLSGISDLKINFFRYKYGNKAYKASAEITKVYESVAGESTKTKKDYTYYAVYTLTNVDDSSYTDWTLTAYFSCTANGIAKTSDEISYTINDSGDDFIYSMDASAVPSLEAVGVKYYDFDGNEQDVFRTLADNGINYIRVRIWNDPYYTDSNGVKHTYGGGNCDLNNAIEIGKRASKYGMKLLVDFHYSDFWADPGKQVLPKAWASYTNSQIQQAVYDYTYDSLETLIENNIDIGMVQVGNETNDTMCGSSGESTMETVCGFMSKGSAAVRQIATDYSKSIKVALHFANPSNYSNYQWYASQLKKYKVDYDVFGTSYYPYWHGSIDNLHNILEEIATTYSKEVMVLETSYANCTSSDGFDSSSNTVYTRDQELSDDSNAYLPYDFTVAGQKNQILTVIDTVYNTTGGIGVSYWEGTWIGAYQALTANGGTYASYDDVWETGCGWGTKYAYQYDSSIWTTQTNGGCSIENEAFFDYLGKPYDSLKLFKISASQAGAAITTDSYLGMDLSLTNGDFESGTDGWTITTTGTNAGYSNSEYLAADSYDLCIYDNSESYTANVYQKLAAGSGTYTISMKFAMNWWDSASYTVYFYVADNPYGTSGATYKIKKSITVSADETMTTYTSDSFTVSSTDTVYIGVYISGAAWMTSYIDDVTLTKKS